MSYTGQKNLHQERHGDGHYTYPNSFFKYHGQYEHNKKQGYGVLEMMDGSSIECHFENGEIMGEGVRRYPNGALFQGYFVMGERHGYGVLYGANNVEKFEGYWEWNRLHGEAQCQLRNQDRIVRGVYKSHHLHGDGIEYWFQNGTAKYEGSCAEGKFSGQGRFEARRTFNAPVSQHEPLPAGTSLPANSIMKRSFAKEEIQPVWECYDGAWERGRKHGMGRWQVRFATAAQGKTLGEQLKRIPTEGDDSDSQFEGLHLLEYVGDWNEDRPTFAITHLVAVDAAQGEPRKIENPFHTNEYEDAQEESGEEESPKKVVAIEESTAPITIPQLSVKQSAPLTMRVFLTRRHKQPPKPEEPVVEEKAPAKGKKSAAPQDDSPPQDKWDFVQITGETGRLIECRLFQIPDAFVKKKPAKGEEPEQIFNTKLPSEYQECDDFAGIPRCTPVAKSNDLGSHANITLDFSNVSPGYYAIRFRNQVMTLGVNQKIEDYIVYVQVVKK